MHRLGICSLTVLAALAAAAAPAERREIRLPDLPGFRTLKCDFHMHTVFSDGQVWPTWRVDEAWRDGLDAIAITDHVEYKPKRDDLPPKPNRSDELARGGAKERDILLVRAAEITKGVPPGHFNALFVTNVTALETADLLAQLEAAKAQDAFVFWNHPGWRVKPGEPVILPIHDEVRGKGLIQGVEIFNGDEAYTNAWPWALQHGLTLLADSDTHDPVNPPGPGQQGHRTMTLVFARERTPEGLKEALRAGRTAVWWGDTVAGRAEFLEPLFHAAVRMDPPHHQQGKTTWRHLCNTSDLVFRLRRTAGPGPAALNLAAGATVLLKLDAAPGVALEYAVENLQTGPGQPLAIRWTPDAK